MFRPGIGSSGGAGAMLIIKRSGGVIQTVTCVDSSICGGCSGCSGCCGCSGCSEDLGRGRVNQEV